MATFTLDLRLPFEDGGPATGAHVGSHVIIENATKMCRARLRSLGSAFGDWTTAIVSLNAEFHRELITGPAEVQIDLQDVGRSSMRWALEYRQHGAPCASVHLILVRLNSDRTASKPFTALEQMTLNGNRELGLGRADVE